MSGQKMENLSYDKLFERVDEESKKYGSSLNALLDHLNMGFVHLFRHLNGNDKQNLLIDLQEYNEKLKKVLLDEGDSVQFWKSYDFFHCDVNGELFSTIKKFWV